MIHIKARLERRLRELRMKLAVASVATSMTTIFRAQREIRQIERDLAALDAKAKAKGVDLSGWDKVKLAEPRPVPLHVGAPVLTPADEIKHLQARRHGLSQVLAMIADAQNPTPQIAAQARKLTASHEREIAAIDARLKALGGSGE